MIVKLLTEHDLEFLSLKGGCTGWFESTLVKMPHCLKSHVMAQNRLFVYFSVATPYSIHTLTLTTQRKEQENSW